MSRQGRGHRRLRKLPVQSLRSDIKRVVERRCVLRPRLGDGGDGRGQGDMAGVDVAVRVGGGRRGGDGRVRSERVGALVRTGLVGIGGLHARAAVDRPERSTGSEEHEGVELKKVPTHKRGLTLRLHSRTRMLLPSCDIAYTQEKCDHSEPWRDLVSVPPRGTPGSISSPCESCTSCTTAQGYQLGSGAAARRRSAGESTREPTLSATCAISRGVAGGGSLRPTLGTGVSSTDDDDSPAGVPTTDPHTSGVLASEANQSLWRPAGVLTSPPPTRISSRSAKVYRPVEDCIGVE